MLLIIPFVLLFFALALSCVRHMHFFQLNSYKFAEHKVWIKRNARSLTVLAVFSVLPIVSVFFKVAPRLRVSLYPSR